MSARNTGTTSTSSSFFFFFFFFFFCFLLMVHSTSATTELVESVKGDEFKVLRTDSKFWACVFRTVLKAKIEDNHVLLQLSKKSLMTWQDELVSSAFSGDIKAAFSSTKNPFVRVGQNFPACLGKDVQRDIEAWMTGGDKEIDLEFDLNEEL